MKSFFSNLLFGFRLSAKDPLTTILSVLLLSFGIALMSVIYQALKFAIFIELPVENQEQVVAIRRANIEADERTIWWSLDELEHYEKNARSYSSYSSMVPDVVSLDNGERFSTQRAAYVQEGFFGVFPVKTIMGRTLLESDSYADAAPVIVINEQVWEEEFERSPNILGKSVIVDGTTYSVIGVTPWEYSYPFNYTLWIPLNFGTIEAVTGRPVRSFPMGRLRENVSYVQAQEEAISILTQYLKVDDKGKRFDSVLIDPFVSFYSDADNKSFGILLLCTALFVLIMATTNVVGLMMNQLFKRISELAIRSSLGATRKVILVQLLTESLTVFFLAVAGSLLNVYIYYKWIFEPMAETEFALPRWLLGRDFFDLGFYLFITGVTLITVLLAQLVPALRATGKNLNVMLRESSRTGSSLKVSRFSKWVVVTQLALSAVVLTTVSLYLSSQSHFREATKIYSSESLTHANIGLDGIHFPTRPERFVVYESLRKELLRNPQIEKVAITNESSAPQRRVVVAFDGVNYAKPEDRPRLFHRIVSPGAFDALGIQLLKGREFSEADTYDSPLVAVVTESTVEKYWPNEDPIGKHFSMDSDQGLEVLTVVGVIEDLWSSEVFEEDSMGFVRPLGQESWGNVGLYVKGRGDFSTVEGIIRKTGRRVNSYMSIMNIQPLTQLQESFQVGDKFLLVIFSSFGFGSVLMLSTGLYGILNNVANNRRREMAIRTSLGASPNSIVISMFKQGYKHTAIGLVIGAIGGYFAASVLQGIMNVYQPNYLEIVAVYVGLFIISSISIGIPSFRMSKLNPMQVLRSE